MGEFAGLAASKVSPAMAQYFFDLRSGEIFSSDEDGIELADAGEAHAMALSALVDAARDAVMEGTIDQHFSVEVRNGTGPVVEVGAVFHSKIFRKQ